MVHRWGAAVEPDDRGAPGAETASGGLWLALCDFDLNLPRLGLLDLRQRDGQHATLVLRLDVGRVHRRGEGEGPLEPARQLCGPRPILYLSTPLCGSSLRQRSWSPGSASPRPPPVTASWCPASRATSSRSSPGLERPSRRSRSCRWA